MKRLILAAGVAALAITAPVAAKPDKERGGNKGQSAKVEHGGGGGHARAQRSGGGETARAQRGGGGERRAVRAERRGGDRIRTERRRGGEMRLATMHQERGRDRDRVKARGRDDDRRVQVRGRDRNDDRVKVRGRDRDQRVVVRGRDREDFRIRGRDRDRDDRVAIRDRGHDRDFARIRDFDDDRFVRRFADRGFPAGFINGCPPGLAKQNELCMPPGQYRKQFLGQRIGMLDKSFAFPLGLRDLYRDTDDYYWRYNDGYAYRVDRDNDLIRALMPLFGGGMTIGQQFPYGFNSPAYYMPSYYQPFYRDSADDYYRYSNGYAYEIDRRTGLIEDIIPLYDQGFGIGQMLPASYGYYNLPYQYRSFYPDNANYAYRYAPGAIYQVDRDTQLITAIASLLMGGNMNLGIGQRLPMGYSAYNVPYGYRDLYYDTPDNWYRYANGNIYQVDPTTQLVTAMVSLLTGGGLGIGQQFPYGYNSPSYAMPAYYQPFYRDTRDDYYRYANGYAYEIDRGTGMIEDVVPLYDRGYGVGQVLPASYSYYNLPDPYRSYYADNSDYYYRYAPGAIYQVDRDTRTISSIASLLSGSGLAIGQPLPVGYGAYNVPYDYRSRYYDTPDSWYRYSNGYIYQVDPQTRLVTALIDAIV